MGSFLRTAAAVCLLGAAWTAAGESESQWLDVPFVRQVQAGCGSAAIAMVMQYWMNEDRGIDPGIAGAEHIHARLKSHLSKKGIPGSALKAYLEQNGFSAYIFNAEIEDLRNHLGKGRPVIVCFAPSRLRVTLHYAVITGVSGEFVYMNDPARGKLTREKRDSFERSWKATGNWALLALPQVQPPRP